MRKIVGFLQISYQHSVRVKESCDFSGFLIRTDGYVREMMWFLWISDQDAWYVGEIVACDFLWISDQHSIIVKKCCDFDWFLTKIYVSLEKCCDFDGFLINIRFVWKILMFLWICNQDAHGTLEYYGMIFCIYSWWVDDCMMKILWFC
jgi:hypothetical protein